MSVYVDDMEAPFRPEHVTGRTYVLCHMVADTHDELIEMAEKIGLNLRWIQHAGDPAREHFDIAKSKRALAIKAGALPVTQREIAFIRKTRDEKG